MGRGFLMGAGGGIDTSDATATKQDILKGKTAYGADGELMTGTIPIYAAGPNPVLSDDIWMSGDDLIYGAGRYGAGGYYEPNANLVGSGYDVARTIGLSEYDLAPGKKVLGKTGKFGYDATATPEDVLRGKVFYNAQGRNIGTGDVVKTAIYDLPAKDTSGTFNYRSVLFFSLLNSYSKPNYASFSDMGYNHSASAHWYLKLENIKALVSIEIDGTVLSISSGMSFDDSMLVIYELYGDYVINILENSVYLMEYCAGKHVKIQYV